VLAPGLVGSEPLPNIAILAFEEVANGDMIRQRLETAGIHAIVLRKGQIRAQTIIAGGFDHRNN
jgi:hypothetical protein